MPTITCLLVANRGEVVSRVARTARAAGIRTVGVYTESDAHARYLADVDLAIALGDDATTSPYLDIQAVLQAAALAGADAVHPGYGFLAENADFAQAVLDAGLTWVGPPPAAIRAMGGKIGAKELARAAGVPVLDGVQVQDDLAEAADAAAALGFPLLVKPSAGGGGKGMHRVDDAADLLPALEAARREALSSFGDAALFVERYIERPHHVEIQVFADKHGTVLHFGERDCSVQRRHQKILEETPAPALSAELRDQMAAAAVSLARDIGYEGAGTVEFLSFDGGFAFLEMNTRLQVEHAVTEEVTGLDLVALQLAVAAGEPLPMTQDEVVRTGHSIEARLYAEDPSRDFMPSPGLVRHLRVPEVQGVRWEQGVAEGVRVSSRYDPMIAKLVAHGRDRDQAVDRLRSALLGLQVHGVRTNRELLIAVLQDPEFRSGQAGTDYLGRRPELLAVPKTGLVPVHAVAAVLHACLLRRAAATVQAFTPPGWRNLRSQDAVAVLLRGDEPLQVAYRPQDDGSWAVSLDGKSSRARVLRHGSVEIDLELDGVRRRCWISTVAGETTVESADGATSFTPVSEEAEAEQAAAAGSSTAPVPGVVVAVPVAAGDSVAAGDVLVVLEAMKMEHRLRAEQAGVVSRVLVAVGDSVDYQQVLVEVDDEEGA